MQATTFVRIKRRVQSAIDDRAMKVQLNLKREGFRSAHIPVLLETSRFTVRVAQTFNEIRQVLHLRYQVFFKEQLHQDRRVHLDIDRFDRVCDHLVIVDNESQMVVGTYRLLLSDRVSRFYSEDEFTLQGLTNLPGIKLELGRACIHPDFRKGIVMTLLWRGLSEYMAKAGAAYLFGCSSVKASDPLWAALIYRRLEELGHCDHSLGVAPQAAFRSEAFEGYLKSLELSGCTFHERFDQESVPALLKGYLRAGAKVCGYPAYDAEFRCFDFLTLLRVESVSPQYREKFNLR